MTRHVRFREILVHSDGGFLIGTRRLYLHLNVSELANEVAYCAEVVQREPPAVRRNQNRRATGTGLRGLFGKTPQAACVWKEISKSDDASCSQFLI